MQPPKSRVLVAVMATTLAIAAMGCGLIGQAKDLVENVTALGDFADRLGKAENLTYTAEYKVGDQGDKVTLVQQPPNVAYLAKDGRYIFTAEATFLCDTQQNVLTCQKSASQTSTVDSADAPLVTGLAGPAFVTPELALGFIIIAAAVPGAHVEQSDRTIAGQASKCAKATGLEKAAEDKDTEDVPTEFTVCVTDSGILSLFSGTSTKGETKSIELTKYSNTADASAFSPPPGAKIVDVATIQPGS